MRLFYLRSEDRVRDFFDGFTLCTHRHGLQDTHGIECLQCLRDLIKIEAFRLGEGPPPGSPVGCIASELVGDKVYYALSVCSTKDAWNKRIARNMAIDRLRNRDKHLKRSQTNPSMKLHTGSVDVKWKPVKIEVLKQIGADPDVPRHARRAAQIWLAKHPPRPVHNPEYGNN